MTCAGRSRAGQALQHRWLSGDMQDRRRGRALDASVVQRLQVRASPCLRLNGEEAADTHTHPSFQLRCIRARLPLDMGITGLSGWNMKDAYVPVYMINARHLPGTSVSTQT